MSDLKLAARRAIALMDLTTLNDADTDERVRALCRQALTPAGPVAAVCIYPRFIPVARATLQALGAGEVRIATVTNFPQGGADVAAAEAETRAAVALGADEVDVVFPYRALLAGDEAVGLALVRACKAACGERVRLKVILESGELKEPACIRRAAELAIEAGADFIKTSTGKVPVNATLEAARVMLEVIRDRNPGVGFKAAGGVRDAAAADYLALAEAILGPEWVSPRTFRFGASSLLANLLATLELGAAPARAGGY